MKHSRLLSLALCLLLCAALLPAPSAGADPAASYAPVLEELQSIRASGGNVYTDAFTYMFIMPSYKVEPGAALADLNGDGVPELLLGDLRPDATYFYDLYTLVDGEPHHVVSSGERYRYSLRDDGLVSYGGSGGAAYSYNALYRFDGYGLTCLGEVYTEGERGAFYSDDADLSWALDHPISMERYEAISQSFHERDIAPTLTPIDQSPAWVPLDVTPLPEDAVFPQVLAQYAAVQANPGAYDPAVYPQVSPVLAAELREAAGGQVVTYQCRDLNGDGVDELLLCSARLGTYGEMLGQSLYEVYALQNGAATPLFALSVSPAQGRSLAVCGDGDLVLFLGDSALEHYRVAADGTLALQARYANASNPALGDNTYTADDGSAVSGRDFWAAHGGTSPLPGSLLA